MLNIIYSHFSYSLLFVWSLLEGETGLVLGGFLSKQGHFTFLYVVLIAFSGAAISDTLLYLTGRFYQKKTNHFLLKHQSQVDKINSWISSYGGWILVFDRFLYGTHIPSVLLIGMAKYSLRKFLLFECIGLILWSIMFTSLGFFFGKEIINIIQLVQHNLLSILFIAIIFFMLYRYTKIEKKI